MIEIIIVKNEKKNGENFTRNATRTKTTIAIIVQIDLALEDIKVEESIDSAILRYHHCIVHYNCLKFWPVARVRKFVTRERNVLKEIGKWATFFPDDSLLLLLLSLPPPPLLLFLKFE